MADEVEAATEIAKAAQEVAKTADNAIDAGRDVGGFLKQVFGGSIVDTVGLYADFIGVYRAERAIRLKLNAARRLREEGVKLTRSVPPKIAIPLLEQALLEDEEPLEILWANLLASAMNPNAADPKRKFVSVLEQLDARDAEVLKALREEWEQVDKTELYKVNGVRYGPSVDGINPHNEISVITLARLGLITPSYTEFDTSDGGGGTYNEPSYGETVQAYGDLQTVQFTGFGIAFCDAVGLCPAEAIRAS